MTTEVKQAVEETVAQVEQTPVVAEAKKTAKKAGKEGEEAVKAAEAKGTGKGTVVDQMKDAVKDVAEKAEKSPVTVKVRQTVKDTAESVHKSPFVEVAHKVLLAGVGAAALAQDEIEDFVNRLVERGEIAEADGKKMLKDITKKRKKVVDASAETTKKVSSDLEKRIEEAMSKMNIPTKDEIEALGAKITALTKKVDELKKSS
jgi:poly(hydroxyalkanoate) granule-associated protein